MTRKINICNVEANLALKKYKTSTFGYDRGGKGEISKSKAVNPKLGG
jgi:hypothetical protein